MTGAQHGSFVKKKRARRALLFVAPLLLAVLFGMNTCSRPGEIDVLSISILRGALEETLRDTSVYALALFILGFAALFLAMLLWLRQKFGARSFRKGIMLACIAIAAGIYAPQPPPPKPVQTELYFDDMDIFTTPSMPGVTPVEPSAPAAPVPAGATGV